LRPAWATYQTKKKTEKKIYINNLPGIEKKSRISLQETQEIRVT
jgi:hypothetical protein